MSAQSPSAYGLSALVHGGAVALILFFSYAADSMVKDSPRVFELVAGSGDNYAATAAPALGNSASPVKLQAPAPLPITEPPVAKELPSPIQSAPEKAPPTAKPRVAKPVDLVASLKRAEARREKKLEDRYAKEQAAEEKRLAAERRVSHIDAEGIKAGILGGSTENKTGGAEGKALTREEGTELEAYFALLKNHIKDYPPPEGMSDNYTARVEFFVAADGSISHVRIITSSGNAEFDRYVIDACEHARPVGPRPDGKSDTVQFLYSLREDEST